MPRSDADHFRMRAAQVLAELTGIHWKDPRLAEFVECVEAAAVARVRRELLPKAKP